MFQDILPKVRVINIQNDQYIALLMDYFHICLECVRKLSIGKTKHLMLKALADTMGGYLQVYILPLTRHSYYAGNIKYRNAKRLFELFDELKNFLHTNGVGWRKPALETKRVKTPPIIITPPKTSVACNGLITYPARKSMHCLEFFFTSPFASSLIINKRRRACEVVELKFSPRRFSSDVKLVIAHCSLPGADARDNRHFAFKGKRFAHSRRRRSKHFPRTVGGHSVSQAGPIIVPLPFLDDDTEPNSIALPFKTDNLQSLYCEKSAFALVKYYVASVKCILSRSKTRTEIMKFNRELFEWLQQSVYSHLDDEKWYPAFGGVLRVMTSLKDSGVGEGIAQGSRGGEYQMMPKVVTETTKQQEEGISPLYRGREGENDENEVTFGTTELIVIAVGSAILVWLLVGLTLVCYRFLAKNSDECSPCESPNNTPVAVLYENTDYCQPDTCPSKNSPSGPLQRFKECWRNKFTSCPDGCERNEDEERCLAAMSYSSKDTIEVSNSSKICSKKLYSKSVSVSPSVSPRDCSSRKGYYSSDEISTNSESPPKSRICTSSGKD
ncbi:uncharacterized protein LOC105703583 [Orussus abietinus]|uniref:uncharacterized protein LOC105703583 n=1 Tax=Orussus abietinus TaxID=222816 RepID=UPI000C715BDA|nr:uncharacterized protein LOC105703583 [Orussus abietinus]